MESKQKRTALVTGGSSGIGRCTVAALSKAGYIVYEFSRRDVPVEGVKHMCVDVTDEASVQEAVGQILLERGSIEILVNCAGFGISGAVEFTELKQAKAQFDVNFFGTVNVSRAVLPSMRRQHRKITTPPICVAGVKYKILRFLCKILPCTLRGKIVGSIYAK